MTTNRTSGSIPLIDFPVNAITPAQRLEVCLQYEELGHILHRAVGQWHTEGCTEAEWETFPNKVKTALPYKPQISIEEFELFRAMHQGLEDRLSKTLGRVRDEVHKSPSTLDIRNIF